MGPDTGGTTAQVAEIPADLRRSGWLGHFPPATEARFRSWLVDQVIPVARIIAGISLPLWLAIPSATAAIADGPVAASSSVVSYGNAAVLAAFLTATVVLRRWTIPLGTLTLIALGLSTMYTVNTLYNSIGLGGIVATAVMFCMLAPFVRLPVLPTVLVTVVVIGTATGLFIHEVRDPRTSFQDVWPYLIPLFTTAALALGSALVNEQLTRTRFVDEQVIARQQELLTESRRLLRRYAPPAVADLIETGEATSIDVPQRRRVTILFSDVVGFTELADRLDPEALTQVVNEYLATLADIIERHRGTLNEFAGDGVMALFGAPAELTPENQVVAAVNAAREIQKTLPQLNRAWMKLGVDHELQTRIGINTGVLSVGSFGSEGRATYTGIGLQTNIAARIQANCEPGRILLSHTSWQLAKDTIECEPRGEITVKGVHFPIQVFAPSAG